MAPPGGRGRPGPSGGPFGRPGRRPPGARELPSRAAAAPVALVSIALLVALPLAGCLAPTPAPGGTPRGLEAFTTLRCDAGEVRADLATDASCNPLAAHQGPGNEVTIAVNPTDPTNVVAASKDYTLADAEGSNCGPNRVWSGIYVSKDGGRTWTDLLFPGYPGDEDGGGSTLSGFDCNTDPVLVFADDGTLYFSGLAYGGPPATVGDGTTVHRQGSAIWVAKSEDGGLTWSDASLVAASSDVMVFHDKQWMAVGPDETVYVTWSAFVFPGDNLPDPIGAVGDVYGQLCGVTAQAGEPCYTDQVLLGRSTDEAATWDAPVVLHEQDVPYLEKQFSTPAVGADGRVYVTWMGEEDRRDRIFLTSSADGRDFPPARPILTVERLPDALPNTEFRVSTYPVLMSDRSRGEGDRLVLTWSSYEQGHADVRFSESPDGGGTWTEPVTVHTDATETDQFMPWVDVAPTGEVHLAWMDRRHDPDNVLIDIYHVVGRRGADGDVIFGPETRLTPVSFDGDEGFHQSGVPFIGDYLGVSAHADVAYVVWPDTRNATRGDGTPDGSWVRTAAVVR